MSQLAIERLVRSLRTDIKRAAERLIRCEVSLDRIMAQPSSDTRDRQVAAVANEIQLITDSLLHFSLGWAFPKMRSHRRKISGKAPL